MVEIKIMSSYIRLIVQQDQKIFTQKRRCLQKQPLEKRHKNEKVFVHFHKKYNNNEREEAFSRLS
jgi:hypothetical protein